MRGKKVLEAGPQICNKRGGHFGMWVPGFKALKGKNQYFELKQPASENVLKGIQYDQTCAPHSEDEQLHVVLFENSRLFSRVAPCSRPHCSDINLVITEAGISMARSSFF